jgi:excisionase family DNA binding protein
MKLRPTQSGVRENTASSRQHAPRLAVGPDSKTICIDEEKSDTEQPSILNYRPATGFSIPLHSASQRATTEGEGKDERQFLTVHEVAELLQVRASWVYGRMRKRSAEQLPGYRVGKYWRFREGEILAWVQSRKRGSHDA